MFFEFLLCISRNNGKFHSLRKFVGQVERKIAIFTGKIDRDKKKIYGERSNMVFPILNRHMTQTTFMNIKKFREHEQIIFLQIMVSLFSHGETKNQIMSIFCNSLY